MNPRPVRSIIEFAAKRLPLSSLPVSVFIGYFLWRTGAGFAHVTFHLAGSTS